MNKPCTLQQTAAVGGGLQLQPGTSWLPDVPWCPLPAPLPPGCPEPSLPAPPLPFPPAPPGPLPQLN